MLSTKKHSLTINQAMLIQYIAILAGGYLLATGLAPLWAQNVYVVHTLFELVCVMISVATFLLVWNTYSERIGLIQFIGFGFIAVAVFDLFHTYYFFGVRALNQGYPDLSTRYWIIGRLVEAVVLYLVSRGVRQGLVVNKWIVLGVVSAFSFGIALLVFHYPRIMPVMLNAEGLTPAKIALEYVVIAITVLTLYNLKDKLKEDTLVSYRHIYMALLLIIPAELLFTLFKVVTSVYSTYGHVIKVVYYYYLYRAVFVSAVADPYRKLAVEHQRLEVKSQELQAMTACYLSEARRLQQVVDSCPLAILMIDIEGKVTVGNQAILQHLNQAADNIIGQPYRKITDQLGLEYSQAKIVRALAGEEIKQEFSKAENSSWICNALPIRDEQSGQITGAIGIYCEVTEHEQMREEIVRLDRLRLVGQMAAGVAHEIRNPMTVVRGYLQFFGGKLEDRYQEQIDMMVKELDRANDIITDFLSLAHTKPSEQKKQDINQIILSVYPLIENEAAQNGIQAKLNLGEDIPIVNLNDREIIQLVLNFSRNAIEAMMGEGQLTIETKRVDGKLRLVIADTGCGISPDKLEHILEPFYTTKDTGIGLGLAVSRQIIERHKGTIDVQSRERQGTTFSITFHS